MLLLHKASRTSTALLEKSSRLLTPLRGLAPSSTRCRWAHKGLLRPIHEALNTRSVGNRGCSANWLVLGLKLTFINLAGKLYRIITTWLYFIFNSQYQSICAISATDLVFKAFAKIKLDRGNWPAMFCMGSIVQHKLIGIEKRRLVFNEKGSESEWFSLA